MKKNLFFRTIYILMFLLLSFGITAEEMVNRPVAVSPGSEKEMVSVGQNCPTFSWSAVNQAASYRVVIFVSADRKITPYENMATIGAPVISKQITGPALSWTLSAEEHLETGNMYIWYVQALDGSGNSIGSWSDGKIFKVEQQTHYLGTREKLEENLKVQLPEMEQNNPGSNNTPVINEILAEGTYNTTYGYAMGDDFFGTMYTFIGRSAGYSNSGDNNTFIGHYSGENNTYGKDNTFVGSESGRSNTGDINDAAKGSQNTFIGGKAGYANTTASYNTCIGHFSGGYNNTTDGLRNSFMGYRAGFYCTGDDNTAIGYETGYCREYVNSACNNSFFGDFTGLNASSGNNNTYLGHHSGYNVYSGHDNTFLGRLSGTAVSTGYNNTILGDLTGYALTTGIQNIFLGYNAGYYETTVSNRLHIDNVKTYSPLLYGEFDNGILTVYGKLGINTKTPDFQIEVETDSEDPAFVITHTDGAQNFIGATESYAQFGASSSHPFNVWANNAWKMMINPNGSLSMYSGASCSSAGEWVSVSSRALKENIENLSTVEAATALSKLNPVKYNYKVDKTDKHVGFIAEDVPELVAAADRKGLSPMDITAVLTKVVQELELENREYTKILAELQERVATLEKK